MKTKEIYQIEDRETGNWKLDSYENLDDAIKRVEEYIEEDVKENQYEPRFYCIHNLDTDDYVYID